MTGRVLAIHVTAAEGAPMVSLRAAWAKAGIGLEGDRYATQVGHYSDDSNGRNLTLIESEVLADLAASGIVLAPGATRRNVTTESVRLNELVGQRFRVGDVECLGIRLCEPCAYMQDLVQQPVLAPLVHRGGLRADILVGGEIRVGDTITPVTEPVDAGPQPARAGR